MSLGVVSLRTSSKGNAFLVRISEQNRIVSILLDAGISSRAFKETCRKLHIDPWIDHIFISHHHIDHSGKVFELASTFNSSVHMTEECWEELKQKRSSAEDCVAMDNQRLKLIKANETLTFDTFSVRTFPVPHDAYNLGFVVRSSNASLSYMLDLGHYTPEILKAIEDVNVLILEMNYDPSLLAKCDYHGSLTARIAGPNGHLGNDHASKILEHFNNQTRKRDLSLVIAAHLSSKNNTPLLALEAIARGWCRGNGGKHLPQIHIASAEEPSPIFTMTTNGLVIRHKGKGVRTAERLRGRLPNIEQVSGESDVHPPAITITTI